MDKENKLTNESKSNSLVNKNKIYKKEIELNSEKNENQIINNTLSENNSNQKNKDEIKLKLLKLLFNEKPIDTEEKKQVNDKTFFETSTDFHRSRLPKIKFRKNDNNNIKEIKEEKVNENNNDKINKDNDNKENINVDINDNINENLNINKEKKKTKKVVKKKVKKKKKKIKKEESNEQYETSIEKLDGEETSTQEEKLSKSLQERKIDNKTLYNIIEKGENMKNKKEKFEDRNEGKDEEKYNIKVNKNEKENIKDDKNEKRNVIYDKNKKENMKENKNENENENVKEKVKDEENIKRKKNEKENVKEDNKEKEIKMAKKEIIKKLIKYSGNKKIFELNGKSKLNMNNIEDKKEKININENKIIENKNISLIKREQIINAKLVNNNSLSSKERMRREQLEKDLENEINKDDLSDEPYEENEIDLNINEKEFRSHSINKRKIKIKEKTENNETSEISKYKKLSNSQKTRKKIPIIKGYKKYRLGENKVYTPKKAIISRESSQKKTMEMNKNTNSKINTSNNLDNNILTSDFSVKNNNIKTKFKIFNENSKKVNKMKIEPNNNTLEFNYPKSIDILSYLNNMNNNNYKNTNGLKKINLRNNSKLLYIKKSPTREKVFQNNINTNYNTFNNNIIKKKPINFKTGLNVNSFNKNKFKKILTNRIINNSTNENISLTDRGSREREREMSYHNTDYNSQLLNESNNINNTNIINKINNNIYSFNKNNNLSINKNIKLNTNANNSFTFRKHIKILNPLNIISPTINLEDFILIENKFFNIIHNLGEKRNITNDCFDLFNFYYNCSIYQGILKYFSDPNIIKLNINYTLMSLLITYDLSFNKLKLNKIYLLLLEMFLSNYRNLILIIEYVINKMNFTNINKIWINKLTNKINKYKESQEGEEIDSFNNFGLSIIEKIKYNTHYLMQKIHYILLNNDNDNNNINNNLLFFLKTINANSYDKINIFFKENIIRENYDFSSLLASSIIKNNLLSNKMNQPEEPYISFPSRKNYTLILDLDETLIYLDKVKDLKDDNGTFKIRPGTFTFLEKMQQFYEIVIFSEAEQNYVDLILSSIEENKKYFDFVLYRHHTTIENEEFIKDLSKIGRKLSKMIIVDNMPQNFRLQPENGIYIKSFWGDDNDDDALFSLGDILYKIAINGGDLREGIKKYKSDIIINVSCSFKDN